MNSNNSEKLITELEEFDNHKFISFIYDKKLGLKGFIAIHRFNKNYPSFGATRFWDYKSETDALKDALRLSRTMSYKAALAGLPGGGAKAVLMVNGFSAQNKHKILKDYARRVNDLSGKFVTGSDVGLTKEDVKKMRRISRYFVGTKTLPEKFTAQGIYVSIKISLKHLFGSDVIENRSFALQGLGKVGYELLKLLYPEKPTIYVSDIDETKVLKARKEFSKIKVVKADEIYAKSVDVFSPCALSNCINYKNINDLRCKLILGGANNQLENNNISGILHKMGILYIPDYIVNSGGLISVYDEYGNSNPSKRRIKKKVAKISNTLEKILEESSTKKKPPLIIANEIAEKIFESYSS